MVRANGFPTDDGNLLRRALDGIPAGHMTFDAEGALIQANRQALEHIPSLRPGCDLRTTLEDLTHVEQVDRLLLRREIAIFAGRPGGPELNWFIGPEANERGDQFLAAWELDWAEAMNERRADFTMAASHELRGPLTTVLGFAEILDMDTSNLTAEQAEAARIVLETARHLAVLVDDVFDLSRNSFGELRLNLAETDLEEIIRSVVTGALPRAVQKGQTIECVIGGPLPLVEVDPARATQMISNLVSNASVHNPEGVAIRVSVTIDGAWIAVSVEDDGIGLPFSHPADAFRTFQRGEAAADGDLAGAGIGLSITKRLIQLHRGDIWVVSNPGEGTRFTLRFPVNREQALTPGIPGPA